MPEPSRIVADTGPLLALIAGTGDLEVLRPLYDEVVVPWEVGQEILAGGSSGFGVDAFTSADWLRRWPVALELAPILRNSLDLGEASVIQLALNEGVRTVCIDEPAGRRMARLHGLCLTGSVGVLVRAKRVGHVASVHNAITRMIAHGIRLSNRVVEVALREAGESEALR